MKMQLLGSMAAFGTVLLVGTLIDSHRARVAPQVQVRLEKPSSQVAGKTNHRERPHDRRIPEALGGESGESK